MKKNSSKKHTAECKQTAEKYSKSLFTKPLFLFTGNVKERELTLMYIPRSIYKFLGYCCGEKYFNSTGTSCSRCSAIFTVFLVPIAIVFGVIALVLFVALILLFLPIFIVFILPCIIVVKCKELSNKPANGPIKIRDDSEEFGIEEGVPLKKVATGNLEQAGELATVNGDVIHDSNHSNGDYENPTETVIENEPKAQNLVEQV